MPQLNISVNGQDIAAINRKLGQIQGTPLVLKLGAAIKEALAGLVDPIRSKAPQPGHEKPPRDARGTLVASVQVWALTKRPGEVAAYAVGPRGGRSKTLSVAPHRHLVIQGHRMVTHRPDLSQVGFVEGNPFVDRAVAPLEGMVDNYVAERVTRLI